MNADYIYPTLPVSIFTNLIGYPRPHLAALLTVLNRTACSTMTDLSSTMSFLNIWAPLFSVQVNTHGGSLQKRQQSLSLPLRRSHWNWSSQRLWLLWRGVLCVICHHRNLNLTLSSDTCYPQRPFRINR